MRHSLVLRILRLVKSHLEDFQDCHIDIADLLTCEQTIPDLLHQIGIDYELSADELCEISREVNRIAHSAQMEAITAITVDEVL